jgi:cytochrome c1
MIERTNPRSSFIVTTMTAVGDEDHMINHQMWTTTPDKKTKWIEANCDDFDMTERNTGVSMITRVVRCHFRRNDDYTLFLTAFK